MTELIKPGVGESLQQVFTALLDELDVAGDFDDGVSFSRKLAL